MTTSEIDEVDYSIGNWAHRALLLMDEANALIAWGSVSAKVEVYTPASKAFWEVCHMLAAERLRIHEHAPEGVDRLIRLLKESLLALEGTPERNVTLRADMREALKRFS